MENKVKLDLGEKSYDIVIARSAVTKLGEFLANGSAKYSKIFIVTDDNVANLHLETVKAQINQSYLVETLVVHSGESSKGFSTLEALCEEILSKGVDRKSLIIALGGGVIGDLAGFVASIIMRGIDFVQIPTTLLSAVDSSVGGKTAINAKAGKNLIGSFYQPKLVLCDLTFLDSLPDREIKAGYAEVLKYGLIGDSDFFEYLSANYQKIFDRDDEVLTKIITKSCQAKAEIVALDEKEHGVRALLNLGHSFGHVLEFETGYSNILNHGEAVAVGMLMAAKMSVNLGHLSQNECDQIESHLNQVGLNIDLISLKNDWNKDNFANILTKDKKNSAGKLNFVLLKGIGKAFVAKDIDVSEFYKVIDRFI